MDIDSDSVSSDAETVAESPTRGDHITAPQTQPVPGTSKIEDDMDCSLLDSSAMDMPAAPRGYSLGGECGTRALGLEEEPEPEGAPAEGGEQTQATPGATAASLREPILALSSRCGSLSSELAEARAAAAAAVQEMAGACASSLQEVGRRSALEIGQYKSELEAALTEKRRLHNCIQEMKGNIRVFCRVRPSTADEAHTAVECRKGGQILTVDLPSKGIDRNGNPRKADQKTFSYDCVFGPGSSQTDVYAEVRGMVDSCYDGYHCTVIAYGQTGSGKTFTMQGTAEAPGISRRALSDIFAQKVRREAGGLQRVAVAVSMVEVYNETFRDLLQDDQSRGRAAGGSKIEVRESSSGSVTIHGASAVHVASAEDVEAVSRRGLGNRSVASTKSNDHSSRSHLVLMVDVEVRDAQGRSMSCGRLSLVDLAGSERISKSEAAGSALTEAKHINKSLSALIDVMCALSDRDRRERAQTAAQQSKAGGSAAEGAVASSAAAHIPFRNSKLTHLLMGSLKPGSKLVFITQVAPETEHVNETCNTLDFGSRAKGLDLGKSKQSAAKAVSLENAERQNEQLARDLERAQQGAAALQQERRQLQAQLAASMAACAELEGRAVAAAQELNETMVRNGTLEEKLAEMEKKMAALVSLNQSLSEKNNRLRDRESRLTTQLQEAQRLQEARPAGKRKAVEDGVDLAASQEAQAAQPSGGSTGGVSRSLAQRPALAHLSGNSSGTRLTEDAAEGGGHKRKKVCFEAVESSSPATEIENTAPSAGDAARKSRAEELARWRQQKTAGGILDMGAEGPGLRSAPSSSLMAGGSLRRAPVGDSIIAVAGSYGRSRATTGRSAMGLGLPSRVVEGQTASGLASSAGRKLASRK